MKYKLLFMVVLVSVLGSSLVSGIDIIDFRMKSIIYIVAMISLIIVGFISVRKNKLTGI
ncbi:hypothetical protein SAMN04488053_102328 [Alkalicoccus daliensis]|uniref:Uncharacterized protein n=1 Tax=Alkalicoccus daliensis TaxID=745820 RepID=A0A1H0D3E4_9BACI|nr:hypothetical protein SAMN04488053_102328 [Alkalicoccus daliensis]